jgi:dTDP-glucose 4,6-dehydratase
MKIYIDIDNTIFKTNKMEYNKITPLTENIEKVNKLYDKGHDIVMWTARGTLSNKCFFDLTYKQLQRFNVKFHELRMGKPA